eukprot:1417236-Rhodomonas_salina.1
MSAVARCTSPALHSSSWASMNAGSTRDRSILASTPVCSASPSVLRTNTTGMLTSGAPLSWMKLREFVRSTITAAIAPARCTARAFAANEHSPLPTTAMHPRRAWAFRSSPSASHGCALSIRPFTPSLPRSFDCLPN